MTRSKLRNLTIDHTLFSMAFDRDVPFHDIYLQSAYLDRESGEIYWVYEKDENAEMEAGIPAEENRAIRERIEATPDRYLEIPELDHADHHDILRAFLVVAQEFLSHLLHPAVAKSIIGVNNSSVGD